MTLADSKLRHQPYQFVAYADEYSKTTYQASPQNTAGRYGIWVERLISQARNTIYPPVGPLQTKTGDELTYTITASTGTYDQVNTPAFFTNIAFRILWIKTTYIGKTTYYGNAFYGDACQWNTLTRSCTNSGTINFKEAFLNTFRCCRRYYPDRVQDQNSEGWVYFYRSDDP